MTNTERIQAHNSELRECIELAENLPEAGCSDPVIEALEITENGTYTAPSGVDGYSPVTVYVPIPDGYIQPSGVLEVTKNGTHDVTEYAEVNVNVPTGGGGGEINTGTCTVVIDPPSKTNYYVCRETVSSGVITYNISKHYTDGNITAKTRCDSVMYVVAGTIKGAEVTDGEVLRLVSGQGVIYRTPSTDGVTATITLSS